MYKTLILIIATFLFSEAQAQIPYIDSKEQLQKGIEFYDKGDYKKSIEQYRQINECDTNYLLAVYETVLSLEADSSFKEAKLLALDGLKMPKSDKRQFLLALAGAFDYMQQTDSALVIYDSLIKLYPNDHQAWYEKGIVYFRKKNYEKAIPYFQQSLIINPSHFKSHYMLGMIYALQGRLSEALIAFDASLLMTQNADLAKQSITLISSIVEETDEVVKLYHEKAEQYSDPMFDELDQLINSKLALSSDYKLKINLNDNVFRQSQVVMEKLKYDPADTNFVMQFYVPLLADVFAKDMFENYMLLLFSGYGYENVDNLAKKKSGEMDDIKNLVFPYFTNIQATRELNYAKRKKTPEKYHYYANDNLIVIGASVQKGKEKIMITGDVVTYRNNNHTLASRGHFNNNGEKDGWWTYYYSTGKPSSREFYRNDKIMDSLFTYYSNGNLERLTTRDHEGNITSQYDYKYNGWLSDIRKIRPDKTIEEQSYYINGQPEVKLVYDGDKVKDGTYTFYHRNGKIKKIVTIEDGKTNGTFKTFFDNGNPDVTSGYSRGKLDGPYLIYYQSGGVKEKYTCANDKATGPYENYYEDGKLSETGVYNKGSKEEVKKYSNTGHLYGVMDLKNDVPYRITFFNEDSQVVYDKESKDGIYDYPLYYANGNKSVDMKINENGFRNGLLTFYYTTGAKSEETNYKTGKLDGTSVSFYKNGQVKNEENYISDMKDGYFKSYFNNGILKKEGWYKEDKKQGLWRFYHVNGTLSYEQYFQDDEINGYSKEYNINGTLADKYIHSFGMPVAHICYDTGGVKTDSVCYNLRGGTCKVTHWQGKAGSPDLEYNTKYGNTDGTCMFRYVNGAAWSKSKYIDGTRDSVSVNYFPDGTLRSKGSYHNGDKTGEWKYYNEAGDITREEQYNNTGDLDGITKSYAPGNSLRVEYSYKDGSKDGPQKYFGETGRTALILYYDDGDLAGYSYEGKDGKMQPEIKIKNGTAKITAYYSNGQKSAETEFEQNMIKGSLKIFYSNGQLAEERNVKCFDLDGPFKRYNPDGKLAYEATYKDDEELGAERSYDKNGKLVIEANYYYGELHGPVTITDPATNNTRTYNYHYGQLTSASK